MNSLSILGSERTAVVRQDYNLTPVTRQPDPGPFRNLANLSFLERVLSIDRKNINKNPKILFPLHSRLWMRQSRHIQSWVFADVKSSLQSLSHAKRLLSLFSKHFTTLHASLPGTRKARSWWRYLLLRLRLPTTSLTILADTVGHRKPS